MIKAANSALAVFIIIFVFSLYLTRKSFEIKISFSREAGPRQHASYNKKDVTIKRVMKDIFEKRMTPAEGGSHILWSNGLLT